LQERYYKLLEISFYCLFERPSKCPKGNRRIF